MKTVLTLALAALLPLIPSTATDALAGKDAPPPFCHNTLLPAIRDLTMHEYPKSPGQLIVIEAFNDLEFDSEASECMANVALVLMPGDLYAIFHIHFNETGKWIPKEISKTPGRYYTPDWKKNIPKSAWHDNWCRVLFWIYPHELSQYGCRPNSPTPDNHHQH